MSAYALSPELWELSERDDRRFRRLLMAVGIPALVAGIVIPTLQLAGQLAGGGEMMKRYARLLPSAPVAEQTEEPKPEVKTTPRPQLTQEQKVARAQKKVAKMLQSLNELQDLTNVAVNADPLTTTVLRSSSSTAAATLPSAATSGGIGETQVVQRESGTGLGERRTTTVKSPVGEGPRRDMAGFAGDKHISGRTLEEIQLVFDRSKGAFYTMYTREQRTRPDMVGKMVVRLTIAPSGAVTRATLVTSELNNLEFERKVIARVLLLNFGAKDVGEFTIDYPIIFFPA
jgi:hypothetical protein